MKVNAIVKEGLHKPILQKTSKYLRTAALGTCLLLSSCAIHTPGSKKDTLQKENKELVASDTTEKRPIAGDLLFGGFILACMGAALCGINKAGDK